MLNFLVTTFCYPTQEALESDSIDAADAKTGQTDHALYQLLLEGDQLSFPRDLYVKTIEEGQGLVVCEKERVTVLEESPLTFLEEALATFFVPQEVIEKCFEMDSGYEALVENILFEEEILPGNIQPFIGAMKNSDGFTTWLEKGELSLARTAFLWMEKTLLPLSSQEKIFRNIVFHQPIQTSDWSGSSQGEKEQLYTLAKVYYHLDLIHNLSHTLASPFYSLLDTAHEIVLLYPKSRKEEEGAFYKHYSYYQSVELEVGYKNFLHHTLEAWEKELRTLGSQELTQEAKAKLSDSESIIFALKHQLILSKVYCHQFFKHKFAFKFFI